MDLRPEVHMGDTIADFSDFFNTGVSSSHYGRIPTADGVAAVPPESISDAFSGIGRVGFHPDRTRPKRVKP
ncbi:hypothetical protein [Kiritimatiella glycovorans]|uniref:hypothetical protein n=1 Tax=Kiritimatiella glycovorans TaxID=1307763 RepID=UPI00069B5FEE|nr:hypothetical protein [Kiritimatiella glycovorans]